MQEEFNLKNGIEPRTILKDIHSPLLQMSNLDYHDNAMVDLAMIAEDSGKPLSERISDLERKMKAAAKQLEFEEAAALRDKLRELRGLQIYAG